MRIYPHIGCGFPDIMMKKEDCLYPRAELIGMIPPRQTLQK